MFGTDPLFALKKGEGTRQRAARQAGALEQAAVSLATAAGLLEMRWGRLQSPP